MRRSILSGFSVFLFSTIVFAAVHAVYRIELVDGSEVLSEDRPVPNGSVMLFHSYPQGILTSVPQENVVHIQTMAHDSNKVLAPGDVVYLGPTGEGQAPDSTARTAVYAQSAIPGGVYDPRNPAVYSYGVAIPRNPNGTPMTPTGNGNARDLARALSGEPPTLDANGFPAQPGLVTVIGPNGTPVLAPAGTPGAVPLTIGPDGNPILTPPGAPGSAPPTIGPNGTPVIGPQGSPGTAQPVIGPNGTPVLAPPGTPGSTPPVIGSNGTPSGPNPSVPVGPNGFPAPQPQPPH